MEMRIMKKVFFILTLTLPTICWADNYVFMKAQRDLNQSLIAFNKKDTECRESAITLPPTIFSNMKINAEEKKVALRYYHAKSLFECTQEEIKNYLLASATIAALDRKSTRLNSSHVRISYAVFCLKKKNNWKWE